MSPDGKLIMVGLASSFDVIKIKLPSSTGTTTPVVTQLTLSCTSIDFSSANPTNIFISFGSADGKVLYASFYKHSHYGSTVCKSDDFGVTFTNTGLDTSNKQIGPIATSFTGDVVVGTMGDYNGDLWQSKNNGDTWSEISNTQIQSGYTELKTGLPDAGFNILLTKQACEDEAARVGIQFQVTLAGSVPHGCVINWIKTRMYYKVIGANMNCGGSYTCIVSKRKKWTANMI